MNTGLNTNKWRSIFKQIKVGADKTECSKAGLQ